MNMARKTDLRPAVMEDRPYLYQSMACSDATPEMMGLPRFPDHPVPDYPTFYEDFDDAAFANESGSRPFIITAAGCDIGAACYTIRGRFAELDILIAARKDWDQGHGIRALEQLIPLLDATGLIDGAIMRPSARTLHCRLLQGRLCPLRGSGTPTPGPVSGRWRGLHRCCGHGPPDPTGWG
ncbi:MAG: hypothetical protein OXF67_08625 [Cyanobacteria bacterium MAG CAR4_bin_6]|nr:hypothetical protein [Cyanobacteria bacterium MAG CAR4_bin_6]